MRRDWRLAAFGGGCTVLGACLLLAACSNTPTKPTSSAPVSTTGSSAIAEPSAPDEQPAETAATPAPIMPISSSSPWDRLRRHYALQSCDYNASVRHWTHVFARSDSGFATSLRDAMPFLLVVMERIEQRGMPAEFAFLPYIESTYTPIASSGDRAAGIWQLMPDTAREAGLRITPEYDGRLDIVASTDAALDLLQHYHEQFGDWRLADMAFNAGEYRLRALVNDNRDDRSENEVGKLRVNAGTHEHLAKLLAAACVVSDPARFKVELPEPDATDLLATIELPAPVDLELAARLSGLSLAQLRHLNPGFLRTRMPATGPFHLLVPAASRIAFEQTLGKLPQYAWRDWHNVTLKQNETIDLFATEADMDLGALAAINNITDLGATLPPGTHLLLPGRAASDAAAVIETAPPPVKSSVATIAVRAGDTLWSIARNTGVHLSDLMRWNGLNAKSTLQLGQRLRLSAPDKTIASESTGKAHAVN